MVIPGGKIRFFAGRTSRYAGPFGCIIPPG